MHELVDFLTQPLAMHESSAKAFVHGLRALDRDRIAEPQSYLVSSSGEQVEMEALESITSGGKMIAVVPLWGPLSMHGGWFSSSMNAFGRTITKLDANEAVSAIVVHVNSPGGTVTGVTEAANALRAVRDRGATKTLTAIEPMMASASTWIGTAAGEVSITPSGDAGSIGVISMYQDLSKMLEDVGVKIDIVRTPALKARFTGVEPLTEEMLETMTASNVAAYEEFVAAMAKNRGIPKSQVESRFGGGELMKAGEAKEAGLVDRIETLGEAIDRLNSTAKVGSRRRASAAAAKLKLTTA